MPGGPALWAWLGLAQAAGPGGWTLAAAVAQAELAHPRVVEARAAAAEQDSGRVEAERWLPGNPTVALGLGRRHDRSGSQPPASGPEFALHLVQHLEVANQRGQRLRRWRAWQTVAEEALAEARLGARAAAHDAFLVAQGAREHLRLAEQRLSLARELERIATDRQHLGAAGDMERQLAAAEAARLDIDRDERARDGRLAALALGVALGLPPGPVPPWPQEAWVAPPPEPPAPGGEVAVADTDGVGDLWERVAARPLMRGQQARQAALAAEVALLRRQVVPNLGLTADLAGQQPGQRFVGLGLELSLPAGQRQQGPLAEARARAAAQRATAGVVGQQLAAEIGRARVELRAQRGIYARWDAAVVPAAEARSQMALVAWKAGKLDFLAVVQSLRDSNEAHRQRLDAAVRLSRAEVELARAEGRR